MPIQVAPFPREVAEHFRHGYAVVDVETSGLRASSDRVLQVAVIQISPTGRVESSWTSTLDPGVDPGPTHIHGLNRERLAGSPLYADIAGQVGEAVAGRVLVAHNARFDWEFLVAESERARQVLDIEHRLCTMALSRRLDLPVESLSLATVARYWGVRQARPHDALDDARVTAEILRHSLVEAYRIGADLPLAICRGTHRAPPGPKAQRATCPWRYPGRAFPGQPLEQGMKVVFTGETATPREVLTRLATEAGLDVMNNVSSRTSLLVCNNPYLGTRKAELAQRHGTTVVTEGEFRRQLTAVLAGTEKDAEPVTIAMPRPSTTKSATRRIGPLSGQRVLVLGGAHEQRAELRTRVVELGGQAAANLTASVTHAVVLPSAETDPRFHLVSELNLPRLDPDTLGPLAGDSKPAPPATPETSTPVVLPRGGVTDLPDGHEWTVGIIWPDQEDSHEVDVVALVLDADEQVGGDEDFCFYNQPEHPTLAVSLDIDGKTEALVNVRTDLLPPGRTRVMIAAAIDGDATFGDVGPIEIGLRNTEGALLVRATLDAATEERTLMLGALYLRNDSWRFRAVGQGYAEGLSHLAVLHGVDVED